jgi:hypothetical protein
MRASLVLGTDGVRRQQSLLVLMASLLLASVATAAPQHATQMQKAKATANASLRLERDSEGRGGLVKPLAVSAMTSADVLRLLELGVPAPMIAERVRANQTHFTKLDDLFVAIRRYGKSSETDSRLVWLVQEISASQFRDGLPCSASAELCSGLDEVAQSAPEMAIPPRVSIAPLVYPAPPAQSSPAAPAAAKSTTEQPAALAPAQRAATAQETRLLPAVKPVTGEVPAETASAPLKILVNTPCSMPEPIMLTAEEEGRLDPDARHVLTKERERMMEAAALQCNSNPHVIINPLRFVFPDTEVGEQNKTSIEISNNTGDTGNGPARTFRILSIKVARRAAEFDDFPESYSLAQPDLQCPMDLTISIHCHLSVVFHPVREKYYGAYVEVITQDAAPGGKVYTNFAYLNGAGYVSDVARLNGTGPLTNHPGLRSVMGFDISGASNAKTQQKFFLEFDINGPVGFGKLGARRVSCSSYSWLPECLEKENVRLEKRVACKAYWMLEECNGKKNTDEVRLNGPFSCKKYPAIPECKNYSVLLERRDPLSRPLWFFLNPRITSVPQSATSLGSLNIQSISDSITGNNNTTAIVQGLDVQGGAELFLIRPRQGLPFWSVVKNAKARVGVALVGGLGFTTPFSPPDKSTQEFTINSTILKQFPNAGNVQAGATCTPPATTCPASIIAFVDEDRTRFFRRYYTGFRFKTYFFSDRVKGECDDPRRGESCEGLINLFPGIVDITAGKDEAVTGGKLRNWVFRLDAVYPLPFIPSLHIFGGANVVFARNTTMPPLVLEPPAKFLPFSDPNIFVQQVAPPNRDTYRIGLGVDLLEVIRSKLNKQPPAAVTHSDAGNTAGTDTKGKDTPATGAKPNT